MASLLKLIGEHPFITVRQLCRLQDGSRSWVYRRLGELEEDGLVRNVNPRHPGIQARAFYYLTPTGAARLSSPHSGVGHYGTTPRRHGKPRFLERIATVYELRNFFISAQRAGLPIFQWQTLTPAAQGVSLHGVALTVDGCPLIVEWDRGERPVRLYWRRLRRVAAVAAKMGAGLLLVAADDARGIAMLSALSGHLDLQGPHLGLTTRTIIATQGIKDAACYVPTITDFLSLGGFVRTLPYPRVDEPLLSQGVMSFRGKWQGNAQLVVELSPLQKMLLSILAGLPLLKAEDLATLAGGRSTEWVRRGLGDLERRGLVRDYVPDPHLLYRYYLPTYAGLAFLAAGCGATTRAYARARGWSVRKGEVSVSHLVRVFQHTQEAREVVLALAREAPRHRQTITWYDEKESYVYFTLGGERRVLAPDARIRWGERTLFVEVDRGTSSLNRLADKLRTYYRFRGCAEHRRFGERFCLLVVAPDTGRERQWLEQTSRLAAEYDVSPLDILTTTREMMRKRGIGAPIWRGVQDIRKRVRLVGEWV